MACSNPITELIHKVLDREASEQERHEVEKHIANCDDCRKRFEQLDQTDVMLRSLTKENVPDFFTEKVMAKIAKEAEKESRVLKWLKRHPFGAAASLFIVLMAGYIFSLWEQAPFSAEVQGKGNISYEGHHTVVVPKGETIKGNLIVRNGKVKIEGRVDGNVILINSDSMLASAGHVTGDIKEVNQILEWLWFHVKQFFRETFFIMPKEKWTGVACPFFFKQMCLMIATVKIMGMT